MSLYKAIEHGKEHRKQYGTQGDYGKLVDKNCRNHGGAHIVKVIETTILKKESRKQTIV